MKITENVPIKNLTTMRMGGPARYVVEIFDKNEIPEAYEFARGHNLPVFILGGGANTIGRDEGYAGVILINRMQGVKINGNIVTAMGGEEWDKVVEVACENGLTGIEALSKIPGSAGAAPVQNIGAYGQDVSQVLKEIEVYDSLVNEFKVLTKDKLGFSYRKSILNTTEAGRYFVVSITMTLREGEMTRPFYNSLEKYITEHNETDFSPMGIRKIVSAIRADKLPDPSTTPSAGSFFKNVYVADADVDKLVAQGIPVHVGADGNKINSGWLIEQAGLSGKILNGMKVSDKASLVLINDSANGYNDLVAARAEIIKIVQDKFGFILEQEPVEIK